MSISNIITAAGFFNEIIWTWCYESILTEIILGEKLHAHHGKNENNNNEYKHQVSQSSHCLSHDTN